MRKAHGQKSTDRGYPLKVPDSYSDAAGYHQTHALKRVDPTTHQLTDVYTFSTAPGVSGEGDSPGIPKSQLVIPHPSGVVFIEDIPTPDSAGGCVLPSGCPASIVVVDPSTGQKLATVSLEGTTEAGGTYAALPDFRKMIVAGDGNAYLPYYYYQYAVTATSPELAMHFVTHLMVVRVSPDGSYNKVELGTGSFDTTASYDTTCVTYNGSDFSLIWWSTDSIITNADQGAAVFATAIQYAPTGSCGFSAQGQLQISYVSKDSITSQVTSANPDVAAIAPILQREDGSFIGQDAWGDVYAVGLDGNQIWNAGGVGTPLYATADGGVIATTTPCALPVNWNGPCPSQLGTLYALDQNGSVSSQTPDTGAVPSWTNQWYLDPEGTVLSVSEPPVDFPQYLYLYKYYLTAIDDYCSTNPLGRTVDYVLTNKAGTEVTDPKFFVYEVQGQRNLARGGPFPGTTIGYPNKFNDWIGAIEYSGSSTQQFGIALARPDPSGAPGGQLIQINWSKFGGKVVSENLITFEKYIPYINGVGCRNQ